MLKIISNMNKRKPIRIVAQLDIKNGMLIKGINLEGLRVLGDPSDFAQRYYKMGIDEIVYIDRVSSLYGTKDLTDFLFKTAKEIFVPLTVGGGITTLKGIEKLLRSGADKVCLNSAILNKKSFLREAVKEFGSANITVIIEPIVYKGKYLISSNSGRDLWNIDPLEWAKSVEDMGAGEILLTSTNYEGLKKGFDIKITKMISKAINIPVICQGGAGNFEHVLEVIKETNIEGVGIASMFHYNSIIKKRIKDYKSGNISYLQNLKLNKKKKNIIKDLKKFLIKNNVKIRI